MMLRRARRPATLESIQRELEVIRGTLMALMEQRTIKEWYTTAEVAKLMSRDEFTVREWARRGRINAQKRISGRGKHQAWAISHEEVLRLQREGLLVPKKNSL
jgi:hypothetical protein